MYNFVAEAITGHEIGKGHLQGTTDGAAFPWISVNIFFLTLSLLNLTQHR